MRFQVRCEMKYVQLRPLIQVTKEELEIGRPSIAAVLGIRGRLRFFQNSWLKFGLTTAIDLW
jgi:hypothetical protein